VSPCTAAPGFKAESSSPSRLSAKTQASRPTQPAAAHALVPEPVVRPPVPSADLDLDVAIDALYGALYYRVLVSGQRLTPSYADALLDQLLPAFAGR